MVIMVAFALKVLCFAVAVSAAAVGNISKDLKPKLAQAAAIYTSGTQAFNDAKTRWAANINPTFDAIVKVTSEQDVQATVAYANARNVPFLVFNGGHGFSKTLNNFKGGIGINMRGMKNVTISNTYTTKGPIAHVQGGAKSGEVIGTAWAAGKTLVAGGCDCTGFTGVTLGGGHGWLQGQYGLAIDNVISYRLVLGNGTAITVSDDEHADLFWAMRGAGHNFGVVTQVDYQVYDRKTAADEGFSTKVYIFKEDKLEAVFSILNTWIRAKKRPVELTHFGVILNNPAVDSKPIIQLLVFWQGPSFPRKYSDPLDALAPFSVTSAYTDLAGASKLSGSDLSGINCAKGYGRQTFPVDLLEWSPANLRAVLNLFAELPGTGLELSGMLLEGYAQNGVKLVSPSSTAFPLREGNILAAPTFTYEAGNATLDTLATRYGEKVRAAMLEGTGLRLGAYVNYAIGDESNEAVYGYEAWRLQRLRGLKRKYDAQGRFRFFEGIKV
ncbi:FAD-binding domain-containing protein [Bimuria novae-zelandiae CBS 107.79]|uniref:FAD-binding domain-containing protein n=1 Tax=Bimuria novae-zelandiae CBS 107.79 TaxID=1447943 RepID=A0A6A5V020_9PLEO|nr:FAD-binding domain-containing protein [Bimuria novae-zelandiae CBS 107.79]